MEGKLTGLNRKEILLYLGYRGQELDPELCRQIDYWEEELRKTARPAVIYRRLRAKAGEIPGFPIEGEDARRLLSLSDQGIFMAATLGAQVDRLLIQTEVRDMTGALILDACASAAIENVCSHLEDDLREEWGKEGWYLSDRFSPGYGDLPMGMQKEFCQILETQKRIGLTVTNQGILVPRKSVTAIIGLSREPVPMREKGCQDCGLFYTCSYRKEGRSCHG